jgi:hypothetical protein
METLFKGLNLLLQLKILDAGFKVDIMRSETTFIS